MTQVSRNALCPCGSGKKYKKCCGALQQALLGKPRKDVDALIVCMPSRGSICYETQLALECNMDGVPYCMARVGRMHVADARNNLAEMALEHAAKNPFPFTPREWFVLWVDDDAWWQPGTVATMLNAMHDLPKLDALFGSFCIRSPYQKTLAFRDAKDPESYPKPGINCRAGEIVPIERCGFHFVLMRLSLLQRLGPKPFTPPPDDSCGEDWAFCERAVSIGAGLGVGVSMPIVHIDPRDGTAYLPGMPSMLMSGNSVRGLGEQHLSGHGSITSGEFRKYGGAVDKIQAKVEAESARIETELSDLLERRRRVSDEGAA